MKKYLKILVLATFSMFLGVAAVQAGSIGIRIASTDVSAAGNETLKTSGNVTNHSADKSTTIPSIFFESSGHFRIGLDYIPFSAEVGSGQNTGDDDIETSGTNTVKANFKNHITIYAEKTIADSPLYVKVGVARVTVQTEDSLSTGAQYGDENIGGFTYGIGAKKEFGENSFFKVEAAKTEYESAKFQSTGSDASTTVNLTDLDTTQLSISIGKTF